MKHISWAHGCVSSVEKTLQNHKRGNQENSDVSK